MATVVGAIACVVLRSVACSAITTTANALRDLSVALHDARDIFAQCKDGIDDVVRTVQEIRINRLVRDANEMYDAWNSSTRADKGSFTTNIHVHALTNQERDELSNHLRSSGFTVRRVLSSGAVAFSIRKDEPALPSEFRDFANAAITFLAKPNLPRSAVMRMTSTGGRFCPTKLRDLTLALVPRGLVCRVGQIVREGQTLRTLTIARKDIAPDAITPAPSRKDTSSRKRTPSRKRTTSHKRAPNHKRARH